MKVLIDTNVLISTVYNPLSVPARVVRHVFQNHTLFLTTYIIEECYEVINRKFPQHVETMKKLLSEIDYLIATPNPDKDVMINAKDEPILNAAISADVDIIVSGDTHFLSLDLDKPKILTPAQYLSLM